MTLTPTEQRVYKAFYNQVCTLEDVKGLLKNYRQAVVACKNLVEKKYFKRVKGGLYVVVPFELAPDTNDSYVPDRYLVADRMIKDRFLSHHTALELHCEAKQLPTVYVTSSGRVPDVNFGGVDYRIITTKHFFGFIEIERKGCMIRVSDRERTVIDCMRQLKFCNGFDEVKRTLPKIGEINFDMLLHYMDKIGEKSLYSRIGYAMELLKEQMGTPQGFLDAAKQKLGSRVYYINKNGKLVKEWKVIV
ncbi:MAG: hypothetical protein KJ709_04835 [Nanoarchaeota archaeon]|nr:hypothetical protein [Nanoarchaeota archaeon]